MIHVLFCNSIIKTKRDAMLIFAKWWNQAKLNRILNCLFKRKTKINLWHLYFWKRWWHKAFAMIYHYNWHRWIFSAKTCSFLKEFAVLTTTLFFHSQILPFHYSLIKRLKLFWSHELWRIIVITPRLWHLCEEVNFFF